MSKLMAYLNDILCTVSVYDEPDSKTVEELPNGYGDDLFDDIEFVRKEILRGKTIALKYASSKIKGDRNFIIECLENVHKNNIRIGEYVNANDELIKNASDDIKNDIEFAGLCAEIDPTILPHFNKQVSYEI